ncbi:MAG TPA: hypothetical protein VFP93_02230 [Gammaproteobacteria bacterium]|nr:hypothetical protein [Gammaproteobacteria bacterium]
MRNLAVNEMNAVAGGTDVYYFDLYAGVEVVGMKATIIGYKPTASWIEPGFLVDHHYEIQEPIYVFEPIYSETVTTVTYY